MYSNTESGRIVFHLTIEKYGWILSSIHIELLLKFYSKWMLGADLTITNVFVGFKNVWWVTLNIIRGI